jgi:hypothetical protein
MVGNMAEKGWSGFPADPDTRRWAEAAWRRARTVLAESTEPWRCGGTWFVGVDALPNDEEGRIDGIPLAGAAVAAARVRFGPQRWHRAQLSVIRPGYPRPSPEESPAAFAFRRDRAAAHVDGLIADGPDKRRFVAEPHAFILGVALSEADPDAAPLVVWEGSHHLIRAALGEALAASANPDWGQVDITDAYQTARREAFARCPRRALPLRPGEAVLLDRHLLHGVAPWADTAQAAPEGRAIAYFRPMLSSVALWAGP